MRRRLTSSPSGLASVGRRSKIIDGNSHSRRQTSDAAAVAERVVDRVVPLPHGRRVQREHLHPQQWRRVDVERHQFGARAKSVSVATPRRTLTPQREPRWLWIGLRWPLRQQSTSAWYAGPLCTRLRKYRAGLKV